MAARRRRSPLRGTSPWTVFGVTVMSVLGATAVVLAIVSFSLR